MKNKKHILYVTHVETKSVRWYVCGSCEKAVVSGNYCSHCGMKIKKVINEEQLCQCECGHSWSLMTLPEIESKICEYCKEGKCNGGRR